MWTSKQQKGRAQRHALKISSAAAHPAAATEIADHLKAKKPVVVNLEKLDKPVALKIFDFLSGAVFALDGSMKKVSNGILLIVPNTMGIMGDFSDELTTQDLYEFF